MKKTTVGILLILMVALFVPVMASASEIGYVDFEFLFYAYPEYDTKNKELQNALEELEVQFREDVEKLESDAEIQDLTEFYEFRFEQIEQQIRVDLVGFILKVIEDVATENGISTVLPDNLIIYGGVNLTVPVVETMYELFGATVPDDIREQM
ncbi:MAG: hypothetical protein QM401_00115 [Bacillota bacterium]|nr:hypothetical protein [Bacillota bacterium]HHU61371.1 OmpH family outer membrane protein [Natronincola sp.]